MISFKSKISEKILSYYFVNTGKSHYINELAKILDVDLGNLFRKLKEMEREGLFCSELRGNQRYFFLNKKCPYLAEYKKIYELRYGFIEILKHKLKATPGLREAYIFGSFAKGNFSEDSDIDLLLVGEHDLDEVNLIISNLEKKIRREINLVDYSSKEFSQKKETKDFFINNIFSNKTIKIV